MKKKLATVSFSLLLIIVGFMSMPNHDVFAFWSKRNPQHRRITELLLWPKHELFNKYSTQMGVWAEEPDERRDWLFAHGDEEKRARNSYEAAIKHYQNYLSNPTNSKELEVAAQCLAHAYHYFEDIGDFSQGNESMRNHLNGVLDNIESLKRDHESAFRQIIADRKCYIQDPRHYDDIIESLKKLKKNKRSAYSVGAIREGLFCLIACLDQVNECFLARVIR